MKVTQQQGGYTGINEILASKAGDTGYVMDDDSYRIIYSWHPYCLEMVA